MCDLYILSMSCDTRCGTINHLNWLIVLLTVCSKIYSDICYLQIFLVHKNAHKYREEE